MQTAGKQQTLQRRSLLRSTAKLSSRGGRVSLWTSLLAAHAIIFVVACAWHVFAGKVTTPQSLLEIAIITVAYTSPITVLAWLATGWVTEHTASMSTGWRRTLLVLAWLASGVIGSLVAWVILSAAGINSGGSNHAFALLPFLVVNGIIAIIISTFLLFFELVGVHFQRSRELGQQEEMLTSEFRAARSVQQSLLPKQDEQVHGFEISGAMAPAVEVGGDYYDYMSFVDGTRGVLVADASGKGIPAALVMAKFQGMAQALSLHVQNITEFLTRLNDTLRHRLDRRSFITVAILTLGCEGECSFYRAGHNPLIHYSAATDAVSSICPSGIALGLADGGLVGQTIRPHRLQMHPGDVALICSDGLNEAVNSSGDEYGFDNVCASLRRSARSGASAREIRAALLNDLAAFVGDAEAHDDITVVIIKKTAA